MKTVQLAFVLTAAFAAHSLAHPADVQPTTVEVATATIHANGNASGPVTTVDPAGPIATSTAAVGDAVSATQNAEGARATASLAACGGDSTAVINARAVSSTTWATVSGAGSASPTVNLGPDYAPTTTVALGTDAPVAKGATDACAALTTASEGATGTASTLSSSTGGRSSAPAASGKGGVVSQDSIKGTTDGAVHQHATRASACGLALAGLAGALLL